jgi:hypothetical protein
MKPPSGGPITGPRSAGTVKYDIAQTRSDFGTVRSRTRRPTGTIIAPPTPWMIRAITSTVRLLAKPHAIDPRVNTTIAQRNTVRAPKRSAIHPLSGMKMARLSR